LLLVCVFWICRLAVFRYLSREAAAMVAKIAHFSEFLLFPYKIAGGGAEKT
jgi:hypothetical protein